MNWAEVKSTGFWYKIRWGVLRKRGIRRVLECFHLKCSGGHVVKGRKRKVLGVWGIQICVSSSGQNWFLGGPFITPPHTQPIVVSLEPSLSESSFKQWGPEFKAGFHVPFHDPQMMQILSPCLSPTWTHLFQGTQVFQKYFLFASIWEAIPGNAQGFFLLTLYQGSLWQC